LSNQPEVYRTVRCQKFESTNQISEHFHKSKLDVTVTSQSCLFHCSSIPIYHSIPPV